MHDDDSGRWRFSLAALFRATTLIALALGWLTLVANGLPVLTLVLVVTLVAFLAAIVGHRRCGSGLARLRAALFFLAGGLCFALYSALVAQFVQETRKPIPSDHPWAGLDGWFEFFVIVLMFPVVMVLLVYMLRAWTWSAYDQEIHDHE